MGLVSTLLNPPVSAQYGPADDYWYQPVGTATSSGVNVTPDNAMRVSAVFACVRVLAETIGQTPLVVYRRLSGGGRERAREHPLYDLLHDAPNRWQTAAEFKEMMTGHVALRGNAYAQILSGERGPVSELVPIHPDRVRVERLPSGEIKYWLRDERGGVERALLNDQVLHLRGLSSDGVSGISVLQAAREAVGLAQVAESYGARSFAQGVKLAGVLQHPGHLEEETAAKIGDRWTKAYGGASNAYKVAVLEEGMTWQSLGMTSDDAQFIETRSYQTVDIARFFRMPLVMIQEQEKTTVWGTGVEQIMIGFIAFTMMSWFVRWEQRCHRDLFIARQTFYPEFMVEALLRGDQKSQAEALAVLRYWGIINADEWREKQNMNPLPDGLGQTYLQPGNMVPAGYFSASGPSQQGGGSSKPPPSGAPGGTDPRAAALASLEAQRIIRKEVKAIEHAARKFADDGEAWKRWAYEFYDEIRGDLERLYVDPGAAYRYAVGNRDELLFTNASVAQSWEDAKAQGLARLLLGGGI